jgi:lipoprotein-releasing system permease protein
LYKFFLSWRYFRSRFMALAALLAVTFGVAMLLIVLSVMGGYITQVQENIRGQEGHLQITGSRDPFGVRRVLDVVAAASSVENVAALAPFIERMAIYPSGMAFKLCQLKGIDPQAHARVTDFGRYVLRPQELDGILQEHLAAHGSASEEPHRDVDQQAATRAVEKLIHAEGRLPLDEREIEDLFSPLWRERVLKERNPLSWEVLEEVPHAAVVGIQLLLERQMFLGQVLSVLTLSPDRSEPVSERFVVTGAVKTGEFSADSGIIYADLDKVKNLLRLHDDTNEGGFRYQGVRVALKDPALLDETRSQLQDVVSRLDSRLEVKTWRELRQNVLKAVLRETILVYFIILILVVFTGSMILLMMVLTVIEKFRDIGILMSLGATPRGITAIFFSNGLAIALTGTALGLGLGVLFCSHINEIHDAIYELTGVSLFQAKIYQLDRIPVAFEPWNVVLSTVPPVVIGLIASLVPALWAARRNPIKAIQYE